MVITIHDYLIYIKDINGKDTILLEKIDKYAAGNKNKLKQMNSV